MTQKSKISERIQNRSNQPGEDHRLESFLEAVQEKSNALKILEEVSLPGIFDATGRISIMRNSYDHEVLDATKAIADELVRATEEAYVITKIAEAQYRVLADEADTTPGYKEQEEVITYILPSY